MPFLVSEFSQIIPVTYPMGQGEPLNAIILGTSDERVLDDNEHAGGLQNYFLYVQDHLASGLPHVSASV